MTTIFIPASVGELVDKVTILEIKLQRIRDPKKSLHIEMELTMLRAILDRETHDARLTGASDELRLINAEIWDCEETVRACDAAGDFGPRFIDAARSIHRHNDARAAVKRRINMALGSSVVEEKSY